MSRPKSINPTQEVEHLYTEVDLLAGENATLLNRATAAELDFQLFRDEVIRLFNPARIASQDFSVTLAKALAAAAGFIEGSPCLCTPTKPCTRCQVLGRDHDQVIPR